ncbi:MAG: hypothetical protein AAGJ93_07305 [Bacteroidota bacterium]
MKKILLLFALFIMTQNLAFTQVDKGLTTEEEIKEKCQQIVDDFTNDEIIAAFGKLNEIWVLPADELDYMEKQSIEQLNIVEGRFGSSIGNKLAKEELIEEVLYRLTYVVKFDKHGLRLRFIFYNGTGGKWYLNSFKWDDSLSKLFED